MYIHFPCRIKSRSQNVLKGVARIVLVWGHLPSLDTFNTPLEIPVHPAYTSLYNECVIPKTTRMRYKEDKWAYDVRGTILVFRLFTKLFVMLKLKHEVWG